MNFAQELAGRRSIRVALCKTYIEYDDLTIAHDEGSNTNPATTRRLITVCQKIAVGIGPDTIAQLTFYHNMWNMPGVGAIFEAVPPLKYAEHLRLSSPLGSPAGNSFEALLGCFAGLGVFPRTFLGQESARDLRLIKVDSGLLLSNLPVSLYWSV